MVGTSKGTLDGDWGWGSGCVLRGINIDIERYGAGTRTVIQNVVKREKMDSKRLKRRHKTRTVKSCP